MNLLIAARPWCVPMSARPFQKGFDDSIIKESQRKGCSPGVTSSQLWSKSIDFAQTCAVAFVESCNPELCPFIVCDSLKMGWRHGNTIDDICHYALESSQAFTLTVIFITGCCWVTLCLFTVLQMRCITSRNDMLLYLEMLLYLYY